VKRAERLHALTETLRRSGARGRTAERLATEFGVSVRTVKRDLAALERSGAAIWSRPGPGGGYGLAAGASLPPVSLSSAQAVALLAAVAAASDAPYADLASAGVRKIVDVLDPRTRARADELAQRVWVDAAPPSSRAVRSALEEAMADQRVVRLRYTSGAGVTTTRDVEPVLFASTAGRWYLVGWCRLRDAVRWFSVDRIERATVTAQPCTGHTVDEVGTPPPNARPAAAHDGAIDAPVSSTRAAGGGRPRRAPRRP
jgi:predicted DNA-binding transcriptional regulator YafY